MQQLIAIALVLLVAQFARAIEGWKPDPEFVRQLNEKRPGVIYDEAKVPQYQLPGVLVCRDGSNVKSTDEWKKRRAELMELFQTQMYGRILGKPEKLAFKVVQEDEKALGGAATMKRVEVRSANNGKEHTFHFD